jgi:hypothetical protein
MQPPSPEAGAAPAPSDSVQTMMAHLDDVMAQAEIAANAERDEEAQTTPSAQPARQEAQPPASDDEDDEDDEDSVPAEEAPDEDESDESEPEEEEAPAPQPVPQPQAEQPKYSRRDAARFASELEQSKRDLQQVQQLLRAHQGELGRVRDTDQLIRRHLQQQSGYTVEQNGRFRYENLSEKLLKGQATQEEADEVAQMSQWHEFAAPIFRAAEEVVLGAFRADWGSLKDLEGIGPEGQQKLNRAPNTVQAAREIHALAYAAGQQKAKSEAQQTIAKLRAENKSLKTSQVARGAQPAVPNGQVTPATSGSLLQRMIDPTTGLPSPDFDREVAAGRWLGVDLESA